MAEKIAKTQLVDQISSKTSLNKKQAGEAIDVLTSEIVAALKEGKTVGLPGLGTFGVTLTQERQAVRPGTTERITVPAGKKIRFKVASNLKDVL